MSLVSRELFTLPEPIDALSPNNASFGTYFDFIYSIDLEIKSLLMYLGRFHTLILN